MFLLDNHTRRVLSSVCRMSGGTEHSLERVADLQQPMFSLTPS